MIPLEWMPPLMFAGLIVFLIIGFPVAFSLAAVGLFFGMISMAQGLFTLDFLQAIPGRIFGSILANDLLLAIPFFTLMGAILEKCGLAEDMLESMGQLFGPMKGGLGYSVIIVGFILGAITGTVAAQVIAMAMITMPVMMRYNYNIRYATGVLAASGTITQLVPPSLVLVVLADQLGRSVGDMYLGAWGPSLLQIAIFALYTWFLTIIRPQDLPPVPRTLTGRPLLIKCMWGIIPAGVLIFLVLGTIMLGLATPTEAGALGTVGAIILSVLRNTKMTRADQIAYTVGLVATGLCILFSFTAGMKTLPFRLSFSALFASIIWLCWRAWQDKPLHDLIVSGMRTTMRITSMVAFIVVGADQPAGRRLGLPDRGQSAGLLLGLLSRFLRNRLHYRAHAGPGGPENPDPGGGCGCGADLVWRDAVREYANQLHAPALRLCAVLSAERCTKKHQDV
jgi:tripartite ATP-independent transporter DctM subunit